MSEPVFVKKQKRHRTIKVMPLNLAPLIDINANLLFFLIIANSVQEDRLQAGKDIELPPSTSAMAEAGDLVSVVVGMDHISVNELNIDPSPIKGGELVPNALDPKKDNRIISLYTRLTERFQDLVKKGAQPGAKDDDDSNLPVVLIQADKRLPYSTVAKVMRTCGEAGFTKFRFAAKAR
ncbi:MAG: biopolymer transporter ExbD [Deltaproteobacteria bacterium]|nr:biopolymer transporter ExbD [Deltaproteobacteria bacterium]